MGKNADFLGTAEPVFRYGYEAVFQNLGDDVLKFSKSITLAKAGNEVTEVYFKNYKKTIAGRSVHEKLALNVEAFVSPNTATKLWSWYRKVYSKPGVVGTPKDYKTNGTVRITDGRGSPVATWQYEGCWPSSIEMGDGDQTPSSSEIIKVVMTIEFDNVTGPE